MVRVKVNTVGGDSNTDCRVSRIHGITVFAFLPEYIIYTFVFTKESHLLYQNSFKCFKNILHNATFVWIAFT